MISDEGIKSATGQAIPDPMPVSWVNRTDAPGARPDYSVIDMLTVGQQKNLVGQIGYDKSRWNHKKIGSGNQLGKYQFSSLVLEQYGIIAAGSYSTYGTDAVNYRNAWRPRADSRSYYNQQIESLNEFLNSQTAQDNLAYQILYDLYNSAIKIGVIKRNDTAEIVAGMLYVCWEAGVGKSPNKQNSTGTGAWAWRYAGVGAMSGYYNSGRYSVAVLSQ